MFDVGFSELVLISVIALVVLGPDRLPGAIRTVGLWVGRLRRSFNNIRSEIEREVGADEIRRQLRNEAIMEKIRNTRKEVVESLHSVKQEAESVKQDLSLDKEFKDLTGRPAPSTETPPPPPPPIPPAGKAAPEASEQSAPRPEPSAAPVPPPAPQPEPVPRPGPEAVSQPARPRDDPESK